LEGKAEGEKKIAIEIAKNCLQQGMDINTIEQIAKPAISEIEKLKQT
jgi:predicted transposase YdaD